MYKKFAMVKEFDCVAVDSSIDLDWAKKNIQKEKVIQGNLDPAYLISGGKELVKSTLKYCKQVFLFRSYFQSWTRYNT